MYYTSPTRAKSRKKQKWSPRGRPWPRGRPQGHIFKPLALASTLQVLENVLSSVRGQYYFVIGWKEKKKNNKRQHIW